MLVLLKTPNDKGVFFIIISEKCDLKTKKQKPTYIDIVISRVLFQYFINCTILSCCFDIHAWSSFLPLCNFNLWNYVILSWLIKCHSIIPPCPPPAVKLEPESPPLHLTPLPPSWPETTSPLPSFPRTKSEVK